ncbi:hypothetical protein FA15DRAFT_693250 [Coprinopsis marcescibilis]|uniref:Uncharacterized protein n=1 Tax=Coprinopsis marcescibilis TaxID=230819 RepID=A0A5C3L1A3_COPMA|nr:hypothetical protein FA15DRAFT_693250 [Coprinopsis marcescibilis]
MSGCPEPLERIFREVEEESERRAEAESHRAAELEKLLGDAAVDKKIKARRRGSISISRLGQLTLTEDPFSAKSPKGPPTPNNFSSIASSSPFYQNQIANASTSSVASGASAFSNDNAHTEDSAQVIQIQQIPSRMSSIHKIIPRRLSRARSTSVIPNADNIIDIGVSIQETTVHSSASTEEGVTETPSRRVSVSASHSLRGQSSRSRLSNAGSSSPPSVINNTNNTSGNWFSRTRAFTQKLVKKSKTFDQQKQGQLPMAQVDSAYHP